MYAVAAAAVGDADDEKGAKTPDQELAISPTFLSRRLHKFGQPDLEIVIGSEQHLVRVHSFLLASVSDYVDTLLSSPAASASQRTQLTFPDISADTWNKMIRFLEPRFVGEPTIKDMLEILPFYDKYQFHSGMKADQKRGEALFVCIFLTQILHLPGIEMCDSVLKNYLKFLLEKHSYIFKDRENFYELVSAAYHMDSPDTKDKCKKWAIGCLGYFEGMNERALQCFLPIVENDEETLRHMCSTFLGKKCPRNMDMDEMRTLVRRSTVSLSTPE